ncbi:hypothetical protein GGP96_003183 [Salinibacter ruber]|nr:hypothetical protein [Salinibacter ruber]
MRSHRPGLYRMRVFVFLIVGMVLLAGCDGGPNDPPPDRPDPPETDNAAPTADLTLDTSEVEIGTEVALETVYECSLSSASRRTTNRSIAA